MTVIANFVALAQEAASRLGDLLAAAPARLAPVHRSVLVRAAVCHQVAQRATHRLNEPNEQGPKAAKAAVLLSGGNPQIAKADGDAPVQAYIAAMPGWKRDLGKRLDALIVRNVPNVRKAVKWNSPFYGIEGQGWFLSFHVFTHYVKVTFFRGTSLRPVPPGGSRARTRAGSTSTRTISTRRRWRPG